MFWEQLEFVFKILFFNISFYFLILLNLITEKRWLLTYFALNFGSPFNTCCQRRKKKNKKIKKNLILDFITYVCIGVWYWYKGGKRGGECFLDTTPPVRNVSQTNCCIVQKTQPHIHWVRHWHFTGKWCTYVVFQGKKLKCLSFCTPDFLYSYLHHELWFLLLPVIFYVMGLNWYFGRIAQCTYCLYSMPECQVCGCLKFIQGNYFVEQISLPPCGWHSPNFA
jgi:hypothetical protein